MRKRKSRSTEAKARKSKRSKTRRNTPRQRHEPLEALRMRRANRRPTLAARASRSIDGTRPERDPLSPGPLIRRATLRGPLSTRTGLPTTLMHARRSNENASGNKTRPSLCTRKKAARRAIIIATGHGGRNNARNYKEHKKCGPRY